MVSKGKAFGRAPQRSKILIVQAPLRVNFAIQVWIAKEGAFVREKPPRKTPILYNPEKPPGGRFFCCRRINPREQKTAKRLFWRYDAAPNSRIGPANSPAFCLAAPGSIHYGNSKTHPLSPSTTPPEKFGRLPYCFFRRFLLHNIFPVLSRSPAACPKSRFVPHLLPFPAFSSFFRR